MLNHPTTTLGRFFEDTNRYRIASSISSGIINNIEEIYVGAQPTSKEFLKINYDKEIATKLR